MVVIWWIVFFLLSGASCNELDRLWNGVKRKVCNRSLILSEAHNGGQPNEVMASQGKRKIARYIMVNYAD